MCSLKNVKKTIGFTVFSLQHVEKAMVLLCFRSTLLKKQWLYCVFAQKSWKSMGFTVFSLKSIEQALVLLCFHSNRLQNHWFYCKKYKKMKKPWVLLWKQYKRAKTIIKPLFFFEKRVIKQISSHGFGPWVCSTRLDKLWGTLTAKLFREQPHY